MNAPHPFGVFNYDLAHLLGGVVLLLSFGLLYQRRTAALIGLYAWQAGVLATAAAWQAWVQGAPELYVTAAVTLVAKAVVIPTALRRISNRLALQRGHEAGLGVFASMAGGVAVVALAVLVVLPTTLQQAALTREDLALALSVVLLGVLVMITRRSALGQVIGFMSLENGLILAALSAAGMPLVVELSVAVLVLVAFVVFAVFVFRIRGHFDSLDTAHLDRLMHGRD